MPGTAALSTVNAKHCVRAASSIWVRKGQIKDQYNCFCKAKKKIGLAIDCSFTFSSAGKDIWQKHLCKDLAVLCKQHGVEMRVWLPTHLKVM